jgi:hypothetical protein
LKECRGLKSFKMPTTAVPLTLTPVGATVSITGGNSIGLTDQVGVTSIPSFTAITGTATLTITPTFGGCVGVAQTTTVTVKGVPTISATVSPFNPAVNGPSPVLTFSNSTGFTVRVTYSGVTSGFIDVPAGTGTLNTLPTTTTGVNFLTVTSVEYINSPFCTNTNIFSIAYVVHGGTGGTIQESGALIGCSPFNPGIINSTVAGTVVSPGTLSYKWQQQTIGNPFIDIAGETGATYTPTNLTINTSIRRSTISTISGSTKQFFSNVISFTVNC